MKNFNYANGHVKRASEYGPSIGSINVENVVGHNSASREIIGSNSLMHTNHLLRQIPVTVLKKLQPHTRKMTFRGGEFIYRTDEKIEWVYFPENTAISELHILEDGRTIEVSITGREGAVGIASLYVPGRSNNWVQVCAPGTVVKIKLEALRKEIRSIDWLSVRFHNALQSYIRQISQKVACNAHHSVGERFSTWLLMLQDRCPSHRLKLTQEHIARVLGVYRPSVTCIAQEMRERGLIDYIRGNIIILDREGLVERSCGCYTDLSTQVLDITSSNGGSERASTR